MCGTVGVSVARRIALALRYVRDFGYDRGLPITLELCASVLPHTVFGTLGCFPKSRSKEFREREQIR